MTTPTDLLRFVDELATASGAAILPFFRTAVAADDKSRGGVYDPVTEADRAAETVMRARIKDAFPTHGIVGEEHGVENADAEHVFILDPIDGTRAFLAGLPTWGTLIGLSRRGRPILGMMHQPFTGERFFGDGTTATFRGPGGERRLRTRSCGSLADAILSTTSPRLFGVDEIEAYERVERTARLTRFGCDCYAYCMLAAGHIDLVVEAGLKSYDIAPLVPIIEGAGGIVTTWDGEPAADGGRIVAAGDARVHAAAIELLTR